MRRPRRGAWILGLLAMAGCALVRPTPGPAPAASNVRELLAGLEARRASMTSLRARARLKAGLAGVWTRQAVLVRRPGDVRVDVLSPFGLALALGTDHDLLWIYPPSQGVRYEGEASPPNLARFLGAPLAVSDLVDILLGAPPARTPVAPPVFSVTADGEQEIILPLADGHQALWFSAEGQLRRAEEHRGDGVLLRLTFDDYRDGFPWSLGVEAPTLGQAAQLAYDTVEPNVTLDPQLFKPPPAPKVLPLEATAG